MLSNKGAPPQFTWATKPAIADWPTFTPIFITDVGIAACLWYHDTINWRPIGGRITMGMEIGSEATPLSSLTVNASPQKWPLPEGDPTYGGIIIPAGMLIPGESRITIKQRFTRDGAIAAIPLTSHVGPLGSNLDAKINTGSLAGTNLLSLRLKYEAHVAEATRLVADGALAENANNGNQLVDVISNFNTAVQQYVTFYATAISAGDTAYLVAYTVEVFV